MKKIFTILLAVAFAGLGAAQAVAAARTASASGNWSDTATWGGSPVPTDGDTVAINSNVTVTVDTPASCASIAIAAPNTVNGIAISGTQSLTVTGAVTTVLPTVNGNHTTIAVGAGSLSAASIALLGGGTVTRYTELTISSGSVTVSGDLSGAGIASLVTFTGAGSLSVGGVFLNASSTFTSFAGSTVNYTGAAQTVKVAPYSNLTLSGSGVKTITSIVVVNGVLSMEGTASASVAPTYGASATLQYNTATARTNGLEWITPFVASGGVIVTNTGMITLNAAKVFNATAPLAIKSGASLASGNFKLTLGGAFVNSGGFAAGTNTVEWNAAGPQTVAVCDYFNLIFSGSGVKSVAAGTTVAGNLSIAPTGSATASVEDGLNLGVTSLKLAGLGRINGTWGSTSAAGAANKNNTFFAPTTGYLTVTTDTRAAPLVTAWPTASSITTNQALGASILTGGSATNAFGTAVSGSFAFTTPDAMPVAGVTNASVAFSPLDAATYRIVTGTVNVAVATVKTYYVAPSGSATPPFDTWGKAATDIQTAVNKASADLIPGTNECVVLVTNDTYTLTNPIIITNGITLRGFGGRDVTFINGNYPAYSNRCIEIRSTPTRATVEGFTITNGYAYLQRAGGGVFVTNAIASILNCTISRNRSATTAAGNGFGAGIGAINCGSIVITNCLISANTNAAPTTGAGTGAYLYWSKGLLADSQILDNNIFGNGGNGGGAYVSLYNSGLPASDFVVSNCLFAGNYADSAGGLFLSGVTATRCIISNNTARANGGGAYLSFVGTTLLTYSTIVGNRAGSGGGVSINRGSLYNCKIIGNYATSSGGGYVSSEGSLVNSLIAGNRADGSGGGVEWIFKPNGYNMINCTVVRNSAGGAGGGINTAATDPNVFINVIVTDNQASGSWDNLAGIVSRTNFIYSCSPLLAPGIVGNISADPLFVDAGSGYGTNAVLGDYRLRSGSPAIDAGTAAGAPAIDLENASRPQDGDGNGNAAHDMGAYEAGNDATSGLFRCSSTVPTNTALESLTAVFTAFAAGPNTNGLAYYWTFGDGTTSDWSSATRVVSHTYGYGTYDVTLAVSNELGQVANYSRSAFINVYPTYAYVATNGDNSWPYGSWGTAATSIQAAVDVAAEGEGYTLAVLVSNGTYRVTNEITIPKGISLRGFSGNWADTIIRGGYPASTNRCLFITGIGAVVDGFTVTNGYARVATGGGISMYAAAIVRNCLVVGNTATGSSGSYGGGIYASDGTIANCTIRNNATLQVGGGGICTLGAVVVSNCLVTGNRSVGAAGGIQQGGGTVVSCIVSNNTAATSGGGVYKSNSGGATLRNSLLAGNQAVSLGGGFYIGSGNLDLQNCTIVGNSAGSGGGVHLGVTALAGANCIVAYNQATNATGTNNIGNAGPGTFVFSCSPDLADGVSNNITADPLFAAAGSGYGTNLLAGNYHLKSVSPCVDTGTNLAWMSTALDVEGYSRVLGAGPNMGAYENTVPVRGVLIIIK